MNAARIFCTGWLLDPADREALLARFPPRYPQVVAEHVTLRCGDRPTPLPTETRGEVVGVADDGAGVQALVVRIAGATDRPDGSTYHVTWSLGPGREARESNDVLARGGWTALAAAIAVRLEPRPWEG